MCDQDEQTKVQFELALETVINPSLNSLVGKCDRRGEGGHELPLKFAESRGFSQPTRLTEIRGISR